MFRVLQITIEAFQPSLVVAGNGSATAGAIDAYVAARQALASPSKKSPLPKASITSASGLGQEAISALQVLHRGRTVTDLITVVARERNVLLTVTMQAQTSGGGYGPVSAAELAGGTQAVAKRGAGQGRDRADGQEGLTSPADLARWPRRWPAVWDRSLPAGRRLVNRADSRVRYRDARRDRCPP